MPLIKVLNNLLEVINLMGLIEYGMVKKDVQLLSGC